MTAREVANALLAHINKDVDSSSLPAGCLQYVADCENGALEEMRAEAPHLFRETLGIAWTAGVSGTITCTLGSTAASLGTLAAPQDGCSIQIDGDTSYNEIRASVSGESGTYQLLFPYAGSSGSHSATCWGDCVKLDGAAVDRVLGCELLHERYPLAVLSSRNEFMNWQADYRYGARRDYGITNSIPVITRTPFVPRAIWLETAFNPGATTVDYRAHCAPLPNATYRATLDVVSIAPALTTSDLSGSKTIPVPGGRANTTFRAIALYRFSQSPWFRNDAVRSGIAAQYQQALNDLRGMRGDDSAPVRIVASF